MIGLSLSYCVKDILDGAVALRDVEKIIAATKAQPGSSDWESVLMHGMTYYWQDYTIQQVEGVIDQLTIEQPRLSGGRFPSLVHTGHWVDSMNEIEWLD